jgi:hypothetical protein
MAARPADGADGADKAGRADKAEGARVASALSAHETATRKLLRTPGRQLSSRTAPGVMVSTTSRFTIPLASLGSSTCSQMATRWPAAMS